MPPRATALRRRAWMAALLLAAPLAAETDWTTDLRYYQFGVVESGQTDRDHAEIGIARAKLLADLTASLRLETHAVLAATSPPRLAARNTFVSGETRRWADLSWTLVDGDDLLAVAELDRLALRWDRPAFRLVAGRQAITWGVSYFWPVLDLFAPFAPDQIDRDYKAGVDALRTTIPAGAFTEAEVVIAGQGRDLPDDLSFGSLGRLHSGATDFGFMAGRFHTDHVVGAFFSGAAGALGLRGELAFTDSGDEADAEIDRRRFVRATLGLDRQISATVGLVAELAWNGYGADDPADYPRLAAADRVRRGEVTSLGRTYTGLSISWRPRPLWSLAEAVLVNWSDGSVLVQSFADRSIANSASIQVGASAGFGSGPRDAQTPGSEYGAVPVNAWAAIKAAF